MTPRSIILQQHGFRYDSPKPPQTLTITASVSGAMIAADSGSGLTNTITWASTTRTKVFTRIPFVPIQYYRDNVLPGAAEFYLLADCCCPQCRFAIAKDSVAGLDGFGIFDFLFPWLSSWAGDGAPDSIGGEDNPLIWVGSGYLDATIGPGDEGYAEQRAGLRRRFCMASDEAGRAGQPIGLFVADNFTRPAFVMPPLAWSYTDSGGASASGSGYVGGLTLPGPGTAADRVAADPCADAVHAESQIIYSGSAVDGSLTSTVSAFTLGMTFDLS